MAELAPPDIEAAVRERLLPLVDVATEVASDIEWHGGRPPVAKISLTDGTPPRAVVIDDSRIAVQLWHENEQAGAELAGRLYASLNSWRGRHGPIYVYACACSRPISLPDPRTRYPRYLLQAAITARLNPI